jgi:hypothetical protein
MLERGEPSGFELYEREDRERLATANAQRNIVRARIPTDVPLLSLHVSGA